MPKEVFAEEIERFFGTLDGVASARVFTTPVGEIAQVYVAAERTADPRAVRRSISTALLSAYGLPVEPWRIQVTQFRGGIRPHEIPGFRIVRVDESLSRTEIAASVQIGWVRAGEEKVATGRARGPSGPQSRLRTVASATVDAIREALAPAHRRLTVQQAGVAAFLEQQVALVGISVPTLRGPVLTIGAAWRAELPELIVAATLDAVTKWVLSAAFTAEASQLHDRREQLESMRRFLRGAVRGGLEPPPPAPAAGDREALVDREALLNDEAPPDDGALPDDEALPDREAPAGYEAPGDEAAGAELFANAPPLPNAAPESQADPDVLTDLTQIRPERKGGATMSLHQESSRGGPVPPRGRTSTMEETFYQSLVQSNLPVHIRCRDGYELPRVVVKDVSTYALLVETPKGTELVFKHAVISISVLPAARPEA